MGKSPFSSIIFRLVLIVALIALLSNSVGIKFVASSVEKQLTNIIHSQQLSFSKNISNHLDMAIGKGISFFTNLGKNLSKSHFKENRFIKSRLAEKMHISPIFKNGIVLISPDGKEVIAEYPVVSGRKKMSFAQSEWFQRAKSANQAIISKPFESRLNKEPCIVFAAPVKNTKNEVIAIVAGTLELKHPILFKYLYNSPLESDYDVLVISPDEKLYVSSNIPEMILKPIPGPGKNKLHDRVMNGFRGVGITVNSRGVEELGAISSVKSTGWFVVVRQPTSKAYLSVKMLLKGLVIQNSLSALIIILIIIIALIVMLSPLKKVAQSVSKMAHGELPMEKIAIVQKDEIGDLVDGFNCLVDAVNERTAKLEVSNQELEKSLEEIKILQGIISICSYCKSIRNDEGNYEKIEKYIHKHPEANFSHTICPECIKEEHPEVYEHLKQKGTIKD